MKSKSKTFPLPADAEVTIWREGEQMCVGLKAPGLAKGMRVATKLSGDAGRELARYQRRMRLADLRPGMEAAEIELVDENATGGTIAWGEEENQMVHFTFVGDGVLDIVDEGGWAYDPYLLGAYLLRIVDVYCDVYGYEITKVRHNDQLLAAMVALALAQDVGLTDDLAATLKSYYFNDKHLNLVQAGDQLAFLVPCVSVGAIRFAAKCAAQLDLAGTPVIVELQPDMIGVDEEIGSIAEYFDVANCVLVRRSKDRLVVDSRADIRATLVLTGDMSADLASATFTRGGQPYATAGNGANTLAHIYEAVVGREAVAAEPEIDAEGLLVQEWMQKLSRAGIDNSEEAARVLIRNGVI